MNLNIQLLNLQRVGDTYEGTVSLPATAEVKALVEPPIEWRPEGAEFFYIHTTLGVQWCNKPNYPDRDKLFASGNCFPTRELAETQAEIDKITRRLNQAAVKYGGIIGLRNGWSIASGNADAYTDHCQYSFPPDMSILESGRFNSDFCADLTRLAELNASLTEQWLPWMKGGVTNG